MFTISLQGIRLFAGRGLYSQEKLLGNEFEIDVAISVPAADTDNGDFIDYTRIYDVVKQAFCKEEELLEAFVKDIYDTLRNILPAAAGIKVCVRKLHPPMPGQVAAASVCFEA